MIADITQRECRRMIASKSARDARVAYKELGCVRFCRELHFEPIAIGTGVYGMNCGLFRETTTGELWAVPDRSSALFCMR